MASSLADLKKKAKGNLEKLKAQKEQPSSQREADDRFWKYTWDKETGKGRAVIRFLPAHQDEDFPVITIYSHSFQGPTGKWYIENSLSTIGSKTDPVGLLNRRLWNSGVESDKDVAKSQKRKVEYIANILVVSDPSNPENDGKVFLFKFGPAIFKKIQAKLFPNADDYDEDEVLPEPVDVYHPWDGCDFKIITKGGKIGTKVVPNYDSYKWEDPAPISEDEDEIEKIWKKCFPLEQFKTEANFKSEEELKKRLFEVLGPLAGSGVSVVEGWEAAESKPDTKSKKSDDDSGSDESSSQDEAEKPQADADDDLSFLHGLIDS